MVYMLFRKVDSTVTGHILLKDCQTLKLDLVIIVDTSTSVGESNFILSLDFIRNILRPLPIGPDSVRVALLRYSSDVEVVSYMNDHMSKDEKIQAVSYINYTKGFTYTDKVLNETRTNVLVPEKADRQDVKDLVILITDGQSTRRRRTLREAAELKRKKKLQLFTIGVTKEIDEVELKNISSSTDMFLNIETFTDLNNYLGIITPIVCSGGAQGIASHSSANISISESSNSRTIHDKLNINISTTLHILKISSDSSNGSNTVFSKTMDSESVSKNVSLVSSRPLTKETSFDLIEFGCHTFYLISDVTVIIICPTRCVIIVTPRRPADDVFVIALCVTNGAIVFTLCGTGLIGGTDICDFNVAIPFCDANEDAVVTFFLARADTVFYACDISTDSIFSFCDTNRAAVITFCHAVVVTACRVYDADILIFSILCSILSFNITIITTGEINLLNFLLNSGIVAISSLTRAFVITLELRCNAIRHNSDIIITITCHTGLTKPANIITICLNISPSTYSHPDSVITSDGSSVNDADVGSVFIYVKYAYAASFIIPQITKHPAFAYKIIKNCITNIFIINIFIIADFSRRRLCRNQ
ncbi:hypothetical protein Btru_043777 [Bulinus truncatus]|nr:hypothetical protein Btru_043777 [Bulinus truncatus]